MLKFRDSPVVPILGFLFGLGVFFYYFIGFIEKENDANVLQRNIENGNIIYSTKVKDKNPFTVARRNVEPVEVVNDYVKYIDLGSKQAYTSSVEVFLENFEVNVKLTDKLTGKEK